ncbi:DUF2157 domain-containing protein [Sphingobium bisphenolivorans]|uniref:DUF2157 domain-containing protein n=1 Tax=Sphingobium bisphenolivorans TaxID=1335760 RepID=UPI00039C70F5|nr:DUF2157 domain-containing protein [Sphingobium bisphenolivorans]
MSERKLKAWQQAGLIDADVAAKIRAWEAQNARPVGLWAIIGLGALTIGLGILSVVAANWNAIPGELRLGLHLALMALLAAFLWWRLIRPGKADYVNDSLLFVAAVLGLTFFAHVGQVYQTSSPLWQPLLLWLIIFSPLLLLSGQGWPVAGLWMAGVLGTAWSHASEYGNLWEGGRRVAPAYPALYWGLIACPPMLIAALAAKWRLGSARPQFWRLVEQIAIATILAGLSIAIIARGWDSGSQGLLGSVVIQTMALLGAAAAIFLARPTRSGAATAGILVVAALVHLTQALLLDLHGPLHGPWLSALLFLLLWGAVAAGALYARWRRIFQGATAVLALRIIILSFELSDDLLGSGVGLILSGAFAMAVAWATVRVSRRYAPAREGGE